jgi:hypothetical protein
VWVPTPSWPDHSCTGHSDWQSLHRSRSPRPTHNPT